MTAKINNPFAKETKSQMPRISGNSNGIDKQIPGNKYLDIDNASSKFSFGVSAASMALAAAISFGQPASADIGPNAPIV